MTDDDAILGEQVSRNGKIGRCDGCEADETYLALTRKGYRCLECLTPEGLADVLELVYGRREVGHAA